MRTEHWKMRQMLFQLKLDGRIEVCRGIEIRASRDTAPSGAGIGLT